MFDGFPTQKFDVVILDPPWKYYGDPNKDQACGKHYGCLTTAPRGAHSQKPEQVQDWIEKMYPSNSKCELFARRQRDGWFCWGNEV